MVRETEFYEYLDLTLFDFYLSQWINIEGHTRTLDKPDESVASILDAAASIKKREDKL
jgi:hypothetical protein